MRRNPRARLGGLALAFALALSVAVGCGGGGPLDECPPNSQEQQDLGSFILFTTCIGCHSENLEGVDRFGAPPGSDFDNAELIKAQADEIYERSIDGSMPPGGGLNDNQLESLRAYLACLP
jgi:mono/diheme cytochrome c family protein